jgi:hypothetical protein
MTAVDFQFSSSNTDSTKDIKLKANIDYVGNRRNQRIRENFLTTDKDWASRGPDRRFDHEIDSHPGDREHRFIIRSAPARWGGQATRQRSSTPSSKYWVSTGRA